MAAKSILIGSLLIILGVAIYAGLAATSDQSPSVTVLIPAMFGLPVLLLGIVALKESLRMHAMHGVAVLALLGTLAPLGRLGMKLAVGETPSATAAASLAMMAVLSAVLLVLCIQSFVAARRGRSE